MDLQTHKTALTTLGKINMIIVFQTVTWNGQKGENITHAHNIGVAEWWDNSLNERMTIKYP